MDKNHDPTNDDSRDCNALAKPTKIILKTTTY